MVKQISFSDHGDDNHISDTLSVLLYKWAQEDGNLKNKLVEILDTIFAYPAIPDRFPDT